MSEPQLLVHPQLKDPPQMQIVNPDRIRIYREARRVSLRRVAKACGCSHTAIADYESGKTKTISEKRAEMLSLILGFTMASVFRASDEFVIPEVSSDSGMVESA
jgi:transcriptional regulator with XRE-family HTH domain